MCAGACGWVSRWPWLGGWCSLDLSVCVREREREKEKERERERER